MKTLRYFHPELTPFLLLDMVNEANATRSSCFGFQMDERYAIAFNNFDILTKCSYVAAWTNSGLNILLAVIAVFYNVKILVNFSNVTRKWNFTNILLFNLALADLFVGLFILPSRALLFGAALLGEKTVCHHTLQILFKSLQIIFSTASFHAVFMVTIERYISVVHCMKCTVVMTKTRMVLAALSGWILSSTLGLLTIFTPRTVQVVLSAHITWICFMLGTLNLKVHMVAKSQRTKIYLQRLSVRREESHPVKKYLKTHKSFAMVITTITLCYFPEAVIGFVFLVGNVPTIASLQLWTETLFFSASTLNPFVYFKQVEKSPFRRKRAMYISTNGGYSGRYNV